MDFYQLECFIHAYESKNFSKAAAEMFLAQTSFTYRIASLEKELGCSLFVRGKHGAEPTEAAHAIYRDALEALDVRARLTKHALGTGGADDSVINVGFNRYPNIDSFFTAVQIFKMDHPQMTINLDLAYISDVQSDIENAKHDVVFYFDYGDKIPATLEFIELGLSPYYAVFGESHPFAARSSITLDDLAGQTYVVPRQYLNTPIQIPTTDVLRKHGITVDATAEDNESLMLAIKTLQGFGVYPVSKPGAARGYIHIPIDGIKPLRYGLLFSRKQLPNQVQEFIRFISESISEM